MQTPLNAFPLSAGHTVFTLSLTPISSPQTHETTAERSALVQLQLKIQPHRIHPKASTSQELQEPSSYPQTPKTLERSSPTNLWIFDSSFKESNFYLTAHQSFQSSRVAKLTCYFNPETKRILIRAALFWMFNPYPPFLSRYSHLFPFQSHQGPKTAGDNAST